MPGFCGVSFKLVLARWSFKFLSLRRVSSGVHCIEDILYFSVINKNVGIVINNHLIICCC